MRSPSLSPPRPSFGGAEPGALPRDVPRAAVARAIEIAALAWVPLAVLAIAERLVTGRDEALAIFARDLTTHVRLLFAAPLLILDDALVARVISRCERHLESSGIVRPGEPRYRAALVTARRLRASRAVLLLIAAVVVTSAAVDRGGGSAGSWLSLPPNPELGTWAGRWLGYVALPLYQLLLLRWLFRWGVWAWFLARVAALDLELEATHPDRCGGLEVLAGPTAAAIGFVVAIGSVTATAWRRAILAQATSMPMIRAQIALLAAILFVILFAPLVVFTPRLLRLRRVGLVEYSRLGDRYARAFREKWLDGGSDKKEDLLGTSDIQSLADLANGMDVVRRIRATPADAHLLLTLAVGFALSMLPVILAEVPLYDLLGKLAEALL